MIKTALQFLILSGFLIESYGSNNENENDRHSKSYTAIDTYGKKNNTHKIGLYYGHEGHFFCNQTPDNTFQLNNIEISNKKDWLTVDDNSYGDTKPDAPLDIDKDLWVFEDTWADVIYSDWNIPQDSIQEISRILKKGGQFIVRMGWSMGWPRADFSSLVGTYEVYDNGLSGYFGYKENKNLNKEENDDLKNTSIKKFEEESLEKASIYFKDNGFSSVKLIKTTLQEITKNKELDPNYSYKFFIVTK